MDWGKAKTILIMSFLALNLLLGYELWANEWNLSTLNSETSGLTTELNRLMASRGILLEARVPKEMPSLKEIVVKSAVETGQSEKTAMNPPVTYSRLDGKGLPKDILGKFIPHLENYQFDAQLSKEGTMVFSQMYGSLPVFEARLELLLERGEITDYRQTYMEVDADKEQKEQQVISAYAAIRTLAENFLTEGDVIKDIRLGYRGRFQLLLPSWRVMTGDGEIYYVNAFNGGVEVPQKPTNLKP